MHLLSFQGTCKATPSSALPLSQVNAISSGPPRDGSIPAGLCAATGGRNTRPFPLGPRSAPRRPLPAGPAARLPVDEREPVEALQVPARRPQIGHSPRPALTRPGHSSRPAPGPGRGARCSAPRPCGCSKGLPPAALALPLRVLLPPPPDSHRGFSPQRDAPNPSRPGHVTGSGPAGAAGLQRPPPLAGLATAGAARGLILNGRAAGKGRLRLEGCQGWSAGAGQGGASWALPRAASPWMRRKGNSSTSSRGLRVRGPCSWGPVRIGVFVHFHRISKNSSVKRD